MIFFVDHDAECLPPVDHYRAPSAFGRMLTTDQVALHQHLLVQCGQILQTFGKCVLHFRKRFHAQPDLFQDCRALRFFSPARKGTITQVPRKPDTATDYNLVMRAFAAQPFSSGGKNAREFHGELESSLSSCLISSRNEAAVS